MRELICINCPLGCRLSVDDADLANIKVSGNTCPRGATYAVNEITAPKRMVTSSVPVAGSKTKRVSVKTSAPIAKNLIFECLEEIKKIRATAPVKIGDVLLSNVCGSGVDIIATRDAN